MPSSSSSFQTQLNPDCYLNDKVTIVDDQDLQKPLVNIGFPTKFSEESDTFDRTELLSLVSRRQKKNAEELLKFFVEHPELITFDSSGTVYIDKVSLPNSRMHVIFPLLFKNGNFSKVSGYNELATKIIESGKGPLISKKVSHSNLELSKSELEGEGHNWYYLGP